MPQVNVRLPDAEAQAIDRLVDAGTYATRSAVVVDAIRRLLATVREAEIAESYRRAYGDAPPADDEAWVLEAGRSTLAGST